MAIFSLKALVAASAFAAFTSARPMAVEQRDVTTWATETDYTTINVPVTLWVDEKGNRLSTVAPVASTAMDSAKVETSALQPSATYSSVVPTTTATTTQASVVPTTTSAAVYTPSTQASVVPTTTPAAVSSSSAPAQSSSTTSSATAANKASSGQSGTVYTGDITYYEGGLGACGWNVDTSTDYSIAMPYEMMGTQSNGNPYCGQSLTIKNPTTGATVQATVGDKCMGCTGASIDLTEVLFQAIGPECDGRCSGFDWWFN